MKIYIIGALKNADIPDIANTLTEEGFDVFADWFSPGPEADQFLLQYAKRRSWNYKQTLQSYAAVNTFEFDKRHIDEADAAVMVMPCGKSGHLEAGYMRGKGKPVYALFDSEPERFDVMYQFLSDIFFDMPSLVDRLKQLQWHMENVF